MGKAHKKLNLEVWQLGCIDKISGEDAARGKPKVGIMKYECKNRFSVFAEEPENIDIMTLESDKDVIEVTIDSGAAESVWPL